MLAQSTTTSHADTVAASQRHTYEVAARDAVGNVSGRSNAETVTTPCDIEITSLAWHGERYEVTVHGAVSQSSAIQLVGDGQLLGSLTANGSFTLATRAAARPSCIEATAACGDVARACFFTRSAAPADPSPAVATGD